MDHALRSISYIADIGDVVVLMARRMPQGSSTSSDEEELEIRRTPRVVCHVFESEEASFIAQSIGQAFQVAYVEFLRANGIDDPAYLREIDYQF
uniref:PID domain-containing protein n=1 Tax=Panagrolaimus davidi TaxID=227884 RepID=A0A914PBU1_9BILA